MAETKRKVVSKITVEMPFIEDENRKEIQQIVSTRVKTGRSSMITGGFGVGKTTLLDKIAEDFKRDHNVVRVSPLGGVYQLLGEMCGISDASWVKKTQYLQQLCSGVSEKRIIFIDEAQHLTKDIYPYLKLIMDAGNVFVLSALPEFEDKLREKHPDVLSRMRRIKVNPIIHSDVKTALPMFDEEAIEQILGYAESMRVTTNLVIDCLTHIKDENLDKVTVEIAEKFMV